ncbi:dihydroorotate dehydrogenase-like protein [Prosthecochloris sp. SCSIO W1101]|uniref:dihydroorotate dehydrogenase-like protein n=1 Tax=Prosthecochloris sp. SCSIO W1101 TaxID=2992242 RepID=UPI00223E4494|nr:dihydroorotate dehydrogenase-like protein [Prosthecochloris sp. SCSIO W1101]UZJ41375.1 dihydroorotate dehydrogenase-like protein [Prosthecochloris sp. SCSIO W1101]
MADVSTAYMGLKLKNPLIVGSSGMTESVESVCKAAEAGAGAVVLKSLFEEQIHHESGYTIQTNEQLYYYAQAEDYIHSYTRGNDLKHYLDLISGCKDAVDIPVIASINCVSASEWTEFASQIQRAGADGLELNIFLLPSDPRKDGGQNEQAYLDVLEKVTRQVSIPVAAKISYYFSGLANMVGKIAATGTKGLVMFNRFFSPDIDIETFEVKSSHVFSVPEELAISLRWVAMLSSRTPCDIAASTGIHNGEALIKQLLAGAKAGQIASVLYRKGYAAIGTMLQELYDYMERHGFSSLDEVVGKMSLGRADNPAAYERVQFMKYFSGIS